MLCCAERMLVIADASRVVAAGDYCGRVCGARLWVLLGGAAACGLHEDRQREQRQRQRRSRRELAARRRRRGVTIVFVT